MDGTAVALGWQLLVGVGCLSGLASGLLGIGGGMILVPGLVLLLPLIGVDGPELPKVAMATSLALVIPTSIAGTQAHAARGTIDWRLWAMMAPALVAGSLVAMVIARSISVSLITLIFAGFALASAWRLLRRRATPLARDAAGMNLPALIVKSIGGGTLASLLGFGVAFFAVPVLSRLIPVPRAIGTASALALPMAIGGTIGYLHAAAPADCPACTGYVYLPAVAAIAVATVLTVPLGARLTSVLPIAALQRLFAVLLVFGAASLVHKKLPDMMREARQALALTRLELAAANAPAAAPAWLAQPAKEAITPEASRPGPWRDRLRPPARSGIKLFTADLMPSGQIAWSAFPQAPGDAAAATVPLPARRSQTAPSRRLSRPEALGPRRSAQQPAPPASLARGGRRETPEPPTAGLLQTLFGR
jgi:uncharacterized membrane protein YfcA